MGLRAPGEAFSPVFDNLYQISIIWIISFRSVNGRSVGSSRLGPRSKWSESGSNALRTSISDPDLYPGSRIQGSKWHRIPDPQHCCGQQFNYSHARMNWSIYDICRLGAKLWGAVPEWGPGCAPVHRRGQPDDRLLRQPGAAGAHRLEPLRRLLALQQRWRREAAWLAPPRCGMYFFAECSLTLFWLDLFYIDKKASAFLITNEGIKLVY